MVRTLQSLLTRKETVCGHWSVKGPTFAALDTDKRFEALIPVGYGRAPESTTKPAIIRDGTYGTKVTR